MAVRLEELEALASRIVDWAGHLAAGTAAWLSMIADFDRAEGYARWECASCAQWLSWQCGLDPRAAREHVRVARRLDDLPLLRAAFSGGEISYSKVRAATRVAEPDTEADLLMLATHSTAAQLERIVAACVRVARSISDDEERARHEARGLSIGWDDDGSMTFTGRLPPADGAVLVKALTHAETALPRDARQEDAPCRRADALAAVAAAYLDGGHNAATQERYQVLVHVDAEALAVATTGTPAKASDDHAEARHCDQETPRAAPPPAAAPGTGRTGQPPEPPRPAARCHLDDGPALSLETLRRLTCDATFVTIIDGADGEPLGIGRRSRRIPPRLRRYLIARDRGCRFPGCHHKRFQAHHVHHWTAGGRTDPDNLIALCAFHHHRVHEGGWTIHRNADGRIAFHDRYGLQLCPTGHTNGSAEPLANLPVEPNAIRCRWDGSAADLDHITTSLYNRPTRPTGASDDQPPHGRPVGDRAGAAPPPRVRRV
jgi:hypothetical protein